MFNSLYRRTIKVRLMRWALLKCQLRLMRGGNVTISSSDGKRREHNLFAVHVENLGLGENDTLLFKSRVPQGVQGRLWDGNRFSVDAVILNHTLDEAKIKVMHVYRGHQFIYDSLFDFIWSDLTFFPIRHEIKELFLQLFSNLTTRFRRERVDLLKRIVEIYLQRNKGLASAFGNLTMSEMALFEQIYGRRVFLHPQQHREFKRFQLLLESLHSSGDLAVDRNGITLKGQALDTISTNDVENRRHRDQVVLSILIVVLTGVIAIDAGLEIAQNLGSFEP
jgi:hypothetical protein